MARYSRSHCLTSMLKDAVMRARIRLANQSWLTHTIEGGGTKGGSEGDEGGTVELIRVGVMT